MKTIVPTFPAIPTYGIVEEAPRKRQYLLDRYNLLNNLLVTLMEINLHNLSWAKTPDGKELICQVVVLQKLLNP